MNPILLGSSFLVEYVVVRCLRLTFNCFRPTAWFLRPTLMALRPFKSFFRPTLKCFRPFALTWTRFFSRKPRFQLTRHGQGFRRHLRFLKAMRLIYMYLQLFHLIRVLLKYSDPHYLKRGASVDLYL